MRYRIVAFLLASTIGLTGFISTTLGPVKGIEPKLATQLAVYKIPAGLTSVKFVDSGLTTSMNNLQQLANYYAWTDAVQQNIDEQNREAAARAQEAQSIPKSWEATAICEEGGRNDPNYGYFGITEWNGFAGYPTAGAAPMSVQLDWEAAHNIGPPDAPGQCHSY